MRERLQKFDYRRSAYVRPNQKWVCGWAVEGRPCHAGPDAKGRCETTFECMPIKAGGDRWQCSRSELAGGKCDGGPLPDGTCRRPVPRCRPMRGIAARRRLTTGWFLALTAGLLLFFLGGSTGPAFIEPGPLTFQQAEVKTCAGCHTAFDKGMSSWPHAAFAEANELRDSNRCLACHVLGKFALEPHGISRKRLAAFTEGAARPSDGATPPVTLAISRATLGSREDGSLPCMTCHQEHRGQDFDLTIMSNQRCMTCHRAAFDSLSRGHPEFSGFPYARRTGIVFDHTSHIGKHFKEEAVKDAAPNECKDCHMPDVTGRAMLVKGFQTTCAACHAGQIEGEGRATAKGLAVFNVPGLDVASLAEKGVAIGDWPEFPDGEITAFMDFLLAREEGYADVRESLADLDLLDLSEASDAEIAAVERFAWSVKGFYFDLATRGIAALKERFEATLGRELATGEVARLAGLLPADAIQASQHAWFPGLLTEVPRHRNGEAVPMPAPAAEAEGDNTAADQKEQSGADQDNDSILDDEDDAKRDTPGEETDDNGILSDEDEDDSILGDDADDDEAEDKNGDGQDAGGSALVASGEDWSAAGGWYRDDYTLRYRPTAHEDAFLNAWIDAAGQSAAADNAPSADKIFNGLMASDSPGLCAKCHSVDADTGGGLTVNWQGARSVPGDHKFTKFSHTAHFSLLDRQGCLTCHTLNSEAKYLTGFEDRDPTTFASNFRPIERQVCTRCHTKAKAGESCLLCHDYHIGNFAPAIAATPSMMDAMRN